jgi:hypothetical protein
MHKSLAKLLKQKNVKRKDINHLKLKMHRLLPNTLKPFEQVSPLPAELIPDELGVELW